MRAPDGHGVPTDEPAVVADVAPVADPAAADPADPATPAEPAVAAEPADPAPLTPEEQAAKDAADAAEFKPHGAPEGEYDFVMPEGVEVDKAMLDVFTPLAKELDLSVPGAQKLVEMYIEKVQPQIAEQFVKGIEADVEAQKAQFAADTKAMIAEDAKAADPADRIFGGKNETAVMQTSARAIDRFGSPELREFLNVSGLGNNPEVAKFMFKVGSQIGEDNDFIRGGQVPEHKSREDKYYGKS